MNEIILEVAALLLTGFCLIYSVIARKELYFPLPKGLLAALKSQHFSFLIMLLSVGLSAAFSIAGSVGEYFRADAVLLEALHTLYYVFHNMLSVFFALYILNMAGPVQTVGKKFFFCFCLPLLLGELLILCNPFTHLCFYVDENMAYHRSTGLYCLYAIGAVYAVTGYLYFFRFNWSISRSDRVATLVLITIALLGVLFQAIWSVRVELFFESIAFLGFMMLLEREPDSADRGLSKRFSGGMIIAIALTFFAVILMNTTLIVNLTSAQSDEIGNIQLDGIRSELQETITDAETKVLRMAIGAEQLLDSDPTEREIAEYLSAQREILAADESVLNVCFTGADWRIFPGSAALKYDRAAEQEWYTGALRQPGQVYISEPYRNPDSGTMCFTVASALSDGETVLAMDLSFRRAQESISQMRGGEEQTAIIVTSGGRIAGYSDMSLVGERLEERLPQYADVFRRVQSSNEHSSFPARIDGRTCTVFSSETSNGWYLILSVRTRELYAESYRQMGLMGAINLLMLAVVVVFYMLNTRNRLRMAEMLEDRERFLAGLVGKLRKPVSQILRLSDWSLIEESEQPGELVGQIRESGLQLDETVNDMQSYSGMLRGQKEKERETANHRAGHASAPSRKVRNGVLLILLFAMLIAMYFCVRSTVKLGGSQIDRDTDGYENRLNEWYGQHQGVLRLFTGLLSTRPALLEDYDEAVRLLDGFAGKYPEFTACYIANPNAAHPLIMNSALRSDERYLLWMRDEIRAPEHLSEEIRVSAPFVDRTTGQRCITLSRDVYSEAGEYLGIFGIDCSIEEPIREMRERASGSAYAFLVDAEGRIINHPNTAYQFNGEQRVSIEDTEYAEAYHRGGRTILRDYNGRLVSCLGRVTDSGFTVMVVERCWSIYGRMALVALASLGLFAICIVLIVMLINRLIRWQEEVNRQLVASADAAVNADKAKSQFLAQMSHEIRTPINVVLGMNDMILSESGDPEILEYAAGIQSAGQTLLSLINGILDFSKLEDGKMELLHVRYETRRLVDDLVHMVSERAMRKGLELRLDIDPELPRTLYGDDMRIRQIVTNLLSNAVKYTPAGSITLRIRLLQCAQERCEMLVAVEDTGIGIREEDVDKLFRSFQRLEQERNRGIEGTGLGIAIVQGLLEMMDSKLEVHSVYGEGSTFSFRLKQQVIDRTPIGEYREAHSAARSVSPSRIVWAPEADVLIVDDNDMNLKVAKGLLKRSGIVPDMADSGARCLEMTAAKHYDIIFLDHMMPGMDGIETLNAMRERGELPADTAVIVLTANAVAGAREAYLKAGFRDYLSKPIVVEELEQMLARYLPEEKLGWLDAKAGAPKQPDAAAADEADPLRALADAGFHTEAGLRYAAGDRDFYLELLRAFAAEHADKARAIADDRARGDLEDYRILIHALKSGARTIGADALSELALEQELAAKNGDAAAVEAGCDPLLQQYAEAAGAIRSALGKTPDAPAQETPEAEIAPEELGALLDEVLVLLGSFEVERASTLLTSCMDRTLHARPLRETLGGAVRALDDFETDAAAQAIRALRASL